MFGLLQGPLGKGKKCLCFFTTCLSTAQQRNFSSWKSRSRKLVFYIGLISPLQQPPVAQACEKCSSSQLLLLPQVVPQGLCRGCMAARSVVVLLRWLFLLQWTFTMACLLSGIPSGIQEGFAPGMGGTEHLLLTPSLCPAGHRPSASSRITNCTAGTGSFSPSAGCH